MREEEIQEEILNILDRIEELLSVVRGRVMAAPKKETDGKDVPR